MGAGHRGGVGGLGRRPLNIDGTPRSNTYLDIISLRELGWSWRKVAGECRRLLLMWWIQQLTLMHTTTTDLQY